MKRAAGTAAAATLVVLAACGGKKPPSLPTGVSSQSVGAPGARKKAPMPVAGYSLTTLGPGTIGPFFARRGSGDAAPGLVAWVTGAEGSGRRMVVVPVTAGGRPAGGEKTAALVANDTTMFVVRPMRGPMPGFVVAWTSLTDRGESLWAAVVGDDGAPRGKAVELARTNDDVIWVDVVPTDAGAVCVWAEETRAGDANVAAAALDGNGTVRGAPARVARGVVGWHALEVPGGVGVSTVAKGGLSFVRLGLDAHVVGAPVAVAPGKDVSGDVEVARTERGITFAWTDRSNDEPAVAAATLDEAGHVTPPRRIVEGRGGAALVHLVHGRAGTAVLFEAPIRRKGDRDRRRVHVARLGEGLAIEGRPASFEVAGRAAPELAPTASGFAMLAAMRDCEPGSAACEDVPAIATLVRLGPKLESVQREVLAFDKDSSGIGWSLGCDGDACSALIASSETPSRVRTVAIRPRDNVPAPPPPVLPPKDAPKLEDVAAIVSGEAVVDLATTELGGASILVTLGAKSARPGDKAQPFAVETRIIDASGKVSAPSTLSPHAMTVGGVAVAPAGKPDDGGVVAWVGRESGEPQVHVARVDKRGRRTNHVQLTTAKGGASDVTVTWAQNGWIVAWVDGRDGNGEVYATKIGLDLARIAREERITSAPGDASDLVALGQGDRVWLAWADPRESPRDGHADVYVTAVKMHDAKRAADETRLVASAAHSRTPQLAPAPSGVHVAWIEEAPLGSETPSSSGFGAMWATLGEDGKLASRPAHVPLAGEGAATSIAIEATEAAVRAVVARSSGAGISLDAVELSSARARAFSLLTLDGPPSLDVALALRGGVLFFNDDGPAPEDKRARRARIAWTSKSDGQGS